MPTYDYTGDGNGTIKGDFFRKMCLLKREVKVSDVIASDTTLTTNGVIAAADVIEIMDVPYGFIFMHSVIRTITPEGAALTADVGIAGSDDCPPVINLGSEYEETSFEHFNDVRWEIPEANSAFISPCFVIFICSEKQGCRASLCNYSI